MLFHRVAKLLNPPECFCWVRPIPLLTSTLWKITNFNFHIISAKRFLHHLLWVTQAKIVYFCIMFIRKKKNRSGSTSVVVADKSKGQFRELTTIGVSSDEKTIYELYHQGKKWIASRKGERDMFALCEQEREEKQVTDYLLSNIENILLNGTQLICNFFLLRNRYSQLIK